MKKIPSRPSSHVNFKKASAATSSDSTANQRSQQKNQQWSTSKNDHRDQDDRSITRTSKITDKGDKSNFEPRPRKHILATGSAHTALEFAVPPFTETSATMGLSMFDKTLATERLGLINEFLSEAKTQFLTGQEVKLPSHAFLLANEVRLLFFSDDSSNAKENFALINDPSEQYFTDKKHLYGTNRVAEWISFGISDLKSEWVKNKLDIAKSKDTLSTEAEVITNRIKSLTSQLDVLDHARKIHRTATLYMVLEGESDLFISTTQALLSACALEVLSLLRTAGTVVLPLDVFFYSLKGGLEGHATSGVLTSNPLFKNEVSLEHIETAGFVRTKVDRGEAEKARKMASSSGISNGLVVESLDKGAKVSKEELSLCMDEPRTNVPQDYNSHIMPVIELTDIFRSIEAGCTEADLNADMDKLMNMMLPRIYETYEAKKAVASHQQEVYSAFTSGEKIQGEIPRQRIFSNQKTDSCELKSTSVALEKLMKDELSYQILIAFLVDKSHIEIQSHSEVEDASDQILMEFRLELASMSSQMDVRIKEAVDNEERQKQH